MAYFERKLERIVARWKGTGFARPLLIQGARRVGKTILSERVGASLFDDDWVRLDFQTDLARMEAIFDWPTNDTAGILRRISEYLQRPISPGRTLIVFDEVQLSERALNSLRFFHGGGQPVIATGSLLGVTTRKRSLPFPSDVQILELHPMDFEEFLWALDQRPMAQAIREHSRSGEPYVRHDDATEWCDRYTVIGGMPGVVAAFARNHSFEDVAEAQLEIDQTYTRDMTDPDNGISGIAARRIWNSLPKQLLRASTKKFKYSDVQRGGRRAGLLEPLEWLAAAGMVTIHDLTTSTQAPLYPYRDDEGSFFKVYCADTGIMFRKFAITADAFLDPALRHALSSEFCGALAENYMMQALVANGLKTYYWMPDGNVGRGEIDFVRQTPRGSIAPIEVKSSRNVSAKTFSAFLREGHSRIAVRVSRRDFGVSEIEAADGEPVVLKTLPLYAAFCIDDELLER